MPVPLSRAEAGLKKGRNRLLVKVSSAHDKWNFSIRLADSEGRRIDGLTAPSAAGSRSSVVACGTGILPVVSDRLEACFHSP